ncbi:MAG: hypothetical protein HWE27_00180 [Gammaproteobacteria bacterium]|nr:hypothetical protein [Gammaproteobacteria bacterium]
MIFLNRFLILLSIVLTHAVFSEELKLVKGNESEDLLRNQNLDNLDYVFPMDYVLRKRAEQQNIYSKSASISATAKKGKSKSFQQRTRLQPLTIENEVDNTLGRKTNNTQNFIFNSLQVDESGTVITTSKPKKSETQATSPSPIIKNTNK